MRVRSRTESINSETALRSGPLKLAGATTVARVRSLAKAGAVVRSPSVANRKPYLLVTDANIARLSRRIAVGAQRFQQLPRSQFHQPDFSRHLNQQQSRLHIAANLFGSSRGPAQELPVTSRRLRDTHDPAL